jgi:hypothetical protein
MMNTHNSPKTDPMDKIARELDRAIEIAKPGPEPGFWIGMLVGLLVTIIMASMIAIGWWAIAAASAADLPASYYDQFSKDAERGDGARRSDRSVSPSRPSSPQEEPEPEPTPTPTPEPEPEKPDKHKGKGKGKDRHGDESKGHEAQGL